MVSRSYVSWPMKKSAGQLDRVGIPSDRELCRALAAGERWAGAVFYRRVVRTVDSALFQALGLEPEREDLAQIALERIVETIKSGRYSQKCGLRAWAVAISRNLAIDFIRARVRERRVFGWDVGGEDFECVAEDGVTPERRAAARRRLRFVMRAVSIVSRTHVEAMLLHDVMGHDLAEVATLTGVSIAAAQSRLVRGRKRVTYLVEKMERAKLQVN
jgi:RNA polymerase sigma-70 factor (ECF subfamily)